MTAPAIIDREAALQRTFAAAHAALDDFREKNPAAAARIDATIAAHMRSAAPMTFMLDTGPIALVDPVAEIARSLKDGSTYRLFVADACVVLTLSHPDAALEPVEIVRLRADLDSVASSIGVTRG